MESHSRTIIKSLTWRCIAFTITTSIAWIITHEVEVAASIGVADTLLKLIAYYGHERVWLKVRFGRMPRPEYEI